MTKPEQIKKLDELMRHLETKAYDCGADMEINFQEERESLYDARMELRKFVLTLIENQKPE